MKCLLFILFLGIICPVHGQESHSDKTFLSKDTIEGELQSIYIDFNSKSELYKRIAYFQLLDFDDESYQYSLDYFKENKLELSKVKPLIPWKNWVSLKQYKGEFYVYHPCDFLFHFRQSINDTTLIDWTGEGPLANKIIEQQKIDRNTYSFLLNGINGQNRKIIIHIINAEKGIAVFEETSSGCVVNLYLMIAAEKITSVPLIVNNCPYQKQRELIFDAINFQSLLHTK